MISSPQPYARHTLILKHEAHAPKRTRNQILNPKNNKLATLDRVAKPGQSTLKEGGRNGGRLRKGGREEGRVLGPPSLPSSLPQPCSLPPSLTLSRVEREAGRGERGARHACAALRRTCLTSRPPSLFLSLLPSLPPSLPPSTPFRLSFLGQPPYPSLPSRAHIPRSLPLFVPLPLALSLWHVCLAAPPGCAAVMTGTDAPHPLTRP